MKSIAILNINVCLLPLVLLKFFFHSYFQGSIILFNSKDVFLSEISFLKAEGGIGAAPVEFESFTATLLEMTDSQKVLHLSQSMGYPGKIDPSEKCSRNVIKNLAQSLQDEIYKLYFFNGVFKVISSSEGLPTSMPIPSLTSAIRVVYESNDFTKRLLEKLFKCLLYKILVKNKDISFRRNSLGCDVNNYISYSLGKKIIPIIGKILLEVKNKILESLGRKKMTERDRAALKLALQQCSSDISGARDIGNFFSGRKRDCKPFIIRPSVVARFTERFTRGGRGGGAGGAREARGGKGLGQSHGLGGSTVDVTGAGGDPLPFPRNHPLRKSRSEGDLTYVDPSDLFAQQQSGPSRRQPGKLPGSKQTGRHGDPTRGPDDLYAEVKPRGQRGHPGGEKSKSPPPPPPLPPPPPTPDYIPGGDDPPPLPPPDYIPGGDDPPPLPPPLPPTPDYIPGGDDPPPLPPPDYKSRTLRLPSSLKKPRSPGTPSTKKKVRFKLD
ncbi:hypothetical protein FG386_002997 [Cryptosporidium ryanae]|uniref:uncharacterized protein n=1 Tax=Cryptosporidium ryanae TaxID=515981 RepID=UPI00351A3FE6|nr:hypothetical protein FG386_002997 [Cryptosporidium ryanae]